LTVTCSQPDREKTLNIGVSLPSKSLRKTTRKTAPPITRRPELVSEEGPHPTTPYFVTVNNPSDSTIQSELASKRVDRLPKLEPGEVTDDTPDLGDIMVEHVPACGHPEKPSSPLTPSASSHTINPMNIQDRQPKSNLHESQQIPPNPQFRRSVSVTAGRGKEVPIHHTSQITRTGGPRGIGFIPYHSPGRMVATGQASTPVKGSIAIGVSSSHSTSANKRKEPPPSDHATMHKRPRIDGAMSSAVSAEPSKPIADKAPTIHSTSPSDAVSNEATGIIGSLDRMEAATANVNTMLKGLIEMCERVRKI
jgi:hypothetical protein